MNWNSSLQNFKNYLKIERNLSENTINSYLYDIKKFTLFLKKNNIKNQPSNINNEISKKIIYEISKKIKEKTQITLITNCNNGIRKIIPEDNSESVEKSFFDNKNNIFFHSITPKHRLFIVGAAHIAQSLTKMAQICGYEVILIDPREHFASEKRFPDCHIINDWPDNALKSYNLNKSCHLVTLTHDPKIDDPALLAVLNSKFGYIGSLGSIKTHQNRVKRLEEQGFDDILISKIHGPVGLDISSKTPEEISVSILAELIKFRRKK